MLDQRRTSEALRESERKYRQIVENANNIVLRWTYNGGITFLNAFGQRFFGYSEMEILGQDVVGTIVPETDSTGQDLRSLMNQICADPAAFEHNVNENMRRNGERVWIAWNNKVAFDDQGQAEGILSIGADITERKLAEEALRQSKNELQCMLNTCLDGILAVAGDGKVLQANQRFAEMWHIPQAMLDSKDDQAILNCVLEQLVTPEAFLQKVQALYKSNEKDMDTVAFKDGRFFERYSAPLVMADSARGRVWFFHDITERKRAEEALRESERRFRSLVVATSQIIWSTDGQGHVSGPIPSFQAYTGQSDEEVQGAGWASALHPDDVERTIGVWASAVEDRTGYETEYRLRGSDGVYRHFASRGAPVIADDGVIREWIGTCSDITERKRAEEALREGEARYRNIFDGVPVSIWEEDWAALLSIVERLRGSGVADFGRYFDEHPEVVAEALRTVEIVDVNTETVRMFKGKDKKDFLASLETVFATPDTLPGFVGELVALAEGKRVYETEMRLSTVHKDIVHVLLKMTFPLPGAALKTVFVTLMNITERKRAEEKLNNQLEELRRWQDVMLDREERVQDLKREINELCLRTGETARYHSQESGASKEEVTL